MDFPRIGLVQYAVLEHLAQTAINQRAQARMARRGWRGGWTYMRFSRRLRPESVQGLIDKGLVQGCCKYHGPYDSVRISRLGIELLEAVRGEQIMVE